MKDGKVVTGLMMHELSRLSQTLEAAGLTCIVRLDVDRKINVVLRQDEAVRLTAFLSSSEDDEADDEGVDKLIVRHRIDKLIVRHRIDSQFVVPEQYDPAAYRDVAEILSADMNCAYQWTQHAARPWTENSDVVGVKPLAGHEMRSTSIGDVIVRVHEGERTDTYFVTWKGFKQIEEEANADGK